jgi:hypothetical protein
MINFYIAWLISFIWLTTCAKYYYVSSFAQFYGYLIYDGKNSTQTITIMCIVVIFFPITLIIEGLKETFFYIKKQINIVSWLGTKIVGLNI